MSVNVSQLLAEESDCEDIENNNVVQLRQDLNGVETDFKFQDKVEPLKFDDRNLRVAKARKRLSKKKHYAEDEAPLPTRVAPMNSFQKVL
jgi:hypothetical protein